MQDLAKKQQRQDNEKSIKSKEKHSCGSKDTTDVALVGAQARGEKEQKNVGNEDVMSGLKYRFVIPKMVGSPPLIDTRWRKMNRSTLCSEGFDEEKVLRSDNDLKIC